jgi:hypothetical protein
LPAHPAPSEPFARRCHCNLWLTSAHRLTSVLLKGVISAAESFLPDKIRALIRLRALTPQGKAGGFSGTGASGPAPPMHPALQAHQLHSLQPFAGNIIQNIHGDIVGGVLQHQGGTGAHLPAFSWMEGGIIKGSDPFFLIQCPFGSYQEQTNTVKITGA